MNYKEFMAYKNFEQTQWIITLPDIPQCYTCEIKPLHIANSLDELKALALKEVDPEMKMEDEGDYYMDKLLRFTKNDGGYAHDAGDEELAYIHYFRHQRLLYYVRFRNNFIPGFDPIAFNRFNNTLSKIEKTLSERYEKLPPMSERPSMLKKLKSICEIPIKWINPPQYISVDDFNSELEGNKEILVVDCRSQFDHYTSRIICSRDEVHMINVSPDNIFNSKVELVNPKDIEHWNNRGKMDLIVLVDVDTENFTNINMAKPIWTIYNVLKTNNSGARCQKKIFILDGGYKSFMGLASLKCTDPKLYHFVTEFEKEKSDVIRTGVISEGLLLADSEPLPRCLKITGNWSYMSSILHCLSNCKALKLSLMNDEMREAGRGGSLYMKLFNVLNALWECENGRGGFSLSEFHLEYSKFVSTSSRRRPMFSPYSHVFLHNLLNFLSFEVNVPRLKTNTPNEKSLVKTDFELVTYKFVKCQCGKVGEKSYNPLNYLNLVIPNAKTSPPEHALSECLDSFFKDRCEPLTDKSVCENCTEGVGKMYINTLPKVLIIHLVRYGDRIHPKPEHENCLTLYNVPKITDHVRYPIKLDLTKYMRPSKRTLENNTLDLFAISAHMNDNWNKQNYTALCKNEEHEKWYSYDSEVNVVQENELIIKEANILFYEQDSTLSNQESDSNKLPTEVPKTPVDIRSVDPKEKDGKEASSSGNLSKSQKFVNLMGKCGLSSTSTSSLGTGLVGLTNFRRTCYMNSIIQCLSNCKEFRTSLIGKDRICEPKGPISEELSKLFTELWSVQIEEVKPSKPICVKPGRFFNAFVKIKPTYIKDDKDQDSHEFLTDLLDVLQKESPHCATYFYGEMRTVTTCANQSCLNETVKEDTFNGLNIPIRFLFYSGPSTRTNLDVCLNAHFDEELVAWKCEKCHSVSGKQKMYIKTLPKVLIIQLKRFQTLTFQVSKTYEHVSYTNEINLTKYMKPPQNQQNIPKNRFNLFAVCAHHGTAEKGHYKSYCKNETNKKWYIYDDQCVEKKQKEEDVLALKDAYILFYKKIE